MPGLIVKNAKLLDTSAAELRPGASLRIEENKIVEVAEDGRELAAGADVVVLDAEDRTLMPGLIDAHVHPSITTLDLTAMVRRQASWVAIETKFILEGMLRRGFTTVRDAGGLDAGIATAIDRGRSRLSTQVWRRPAAGPLQVASTTIHGPLEAWSADIILAAM
jgi:imidazolonepropionase-like amidohydrolase